MAERALPVARPPRRLGRRLLRAAAVLLLALLVLVAAWLASNAVDSRPQPRPAALQWAGEPANSTMALVLAGVRAPAGSDALADGRRQWAEVLDGAALAVLAPATPASAAAAPLLSAISGPPLLCGQAQSCLLDWQRPADDALAASLGAQLQAHAQLGQRCDQALAGAPFAEPVPVDPRPDSALARHAQGAVQCGLWFAGQALLAAARADQTEALLALVQGERLSASLLAGSHTLLAHAVAWSIARRQHEAVAAVLARRPAWAPALAPLAQPWPNEWLQPLRWAPVELAMTHGLFSRMRNDCARTDAPVPQDLVDRWFCTTGLGLLPQATLQSLDARWLAWLQGDPPDGRTVLQRAVARQAAGEAGAHSGWSLHWRNTLGEWLLDGSLPQFEAHVARQADVGLQRQALALAIQAVALAPGAREAWLQQQRLPAELRGRLRFSDGGLVLQAASWEAQLSPSVTERPIRLPVPAP